MPFASTTIPANTKDYRTGVGRSQDKQDASSALSKWRILCTGTVRAISAMELTVFMFTRERVEQDIGMGTSALELLSAATPVGAIVGGPLFGFVADVHGRQMALLLSMALALLGLGMSTTARVDYEALITRVVAGIGLSGEVPAVVVLVYELAPHGRRASAVAFLHAFAAVGAVIGLLLAHFVAPMIGWRALYLALTTLSLFIAVVRVSLPESPLWMASRGRADEALALVTHQERTSVSSNPCGEEFHSVLIDEDTLSAMENPSSSSWVASSTPKHTEFVASLATDTEQSSSILSLAVLFLLWTVLNVCAFALGSYVPTLISLADFNVYASWCTCVLMYSAPFFGSALACVLLDQHQRWKHIHSFASVNRRKLTLAMFAIVTAVFAVSLSYLPWSGPVVTTGASLVSMSLSGVWSAVLAYTPEHFSVSKRARGVGIAVAFGGIGGFIGALGMFPRVYDVWMLSVPVVVWTFGGALVVFAAVLVPLVGSSRASPGSCEAQR